LQTPLVLLGHENVVVPLQVGAVVAQLWGSAAPVPVHVDAVHPLWPWLTQAPVVHWPSLVQ
jgi:hypothetical protein